MFPNRGAHAVPQWFQVGIINAGPLDGVLVNRHSLFEPLLTFVQSPQLGAVAREVVQYRPHLGKPVRHGQQVIERFLGALQFMQGKGPVNPSIRSVGGELSG